MDTIRVEGMVASMSRSKSMASTGERVKPQDVFLGKPEKTTVTNTPCIEPDEILKSTVAHSGLDSFQVALPKEEAWKTLMDPLLGAGVAAGVWAAMPYVAIGSCLLLNLSLARKASVAKAEEAERQNFLARKTDRTLYNQAMAAIKQQDFADLAKAQAGESLFNQEAIKALVVQVLINQGRDRKTRNEFEQQTVNLLADIIRQKDTIIRDKDAIILDKDRKIGEMEALLNAEAVPQDSESVCERQDSSVQQGDGTTAATVALELKTPQNNRSLETRLLWALSGTSILWGAVQMFAGH